MPVPPGIRSLPCRWSSRLRGAGIASAICLLLVMAVLVPGCSDGEKKNLSDQTRIYHGEFPPGLLEDMQYTSMNLSLHSTPVISPDLRLRNLSVGSLKDGNLLFQGAVDILEGPPVRGYLVVQVEVLGNDSGVLRTSPPLVSTRNPGPGDTFDFFYVTTEPVSDRAASYRIAVQVSDRYPGV